MTKLEFIAGEHIVRQGDKGDSVYLIKEGVVRCQRGDQFIRRMKKGEYFGEFSILFETTRSIDVIAENDCVCLNISQDELKDIFNGNHKGRLFNRLLRLALSKSKIMKILLEPLFFDEVENSLRLVKYKNKDVIFDKENKNKVCVFVFGGLTDVWS